MKRIPNYALYGEAALPEWRDLLHVEWIRQRSLEYQCEIHPHRHDSLLQLLYISQGEGEISIDQWREPVHAPCLILLPCNTVHAFRCSPDTDGMVITAAQRPLQSMMQVAGGDEQQLLRPRVMQLEEDEQRFSALLHLVEAEAHGLPNGHAGAGLALLVALLLRIDPGASDGRQLNGGRRMAVLERFRELVQEHYRQHWSLAHYADALGLSSAQLGRICREALGEAPMALVNDQLVREACRLLAYTTLEVKQVAHSLGFVDSAYFSRFFRKHTEVTPREFRQRFQAGSAAA